MATARVVDVAVRRHVFTTDKPFADAMDGIFNGISRPDIEKMFKELDAASSYQEFSAVVGRRARQA